MHKTQTENGHSLFQAPQYQAESTGKWYPHILDALADQPALTWDPAAVLSTLSYGYPFGDATLFREIRRQPWLSEVDEHGNVQEMPIPPHGLWGGSAKEIGKRLFELMCDEAEMACRDRDQIYILLSGGLDSRIVAGVVHHLHQTGKIRSKISAVTWGIENCRDVYYGKCVAGRLGFPWFHAVLNQQEYFRNISLCATSLAAAVSPAHLHRMNWFEDVSPDSLVLAGSLGNMIGRGQITSRSMLEVLPLKPFNYLDLMTRQAAAEGSEECQAELKRLRDRAGKGLENYVYREHEQAAHFSRGMLCQTMSIINQYCDVYQMLSSRDVYSFMWSRHPAVRTDQVYVEVLGLVGSEVAAVPWTRTNKAVSGTFDAQQGNLEKEHNDYRGWTHNYLKSDDFDQSDFLQRISSTGLFDTARLEQVIGEFRTGKNAWAVEASQFPWMVGWLISLDKLLKSIPEKTAAWRPANPESSSGEPEIAPPRWRTLRRYFANNAWLRSRIAKVRRAQVTKAFLRRHPVRTDPELNRQNGYDK